MSASINKQCISNPKYLQFFTMLYATIMLVTVVMCYKIISVHGAIFSVATFIFPFWYSTSDIVAEVYGYSASRRLIWYGVICQFVFVIATNVLINILPSTSHHQAAYEIVFTETPRVAISSLIASFLGGFLNIYCISKWKILTRGRFFWLRSLGSSIIGLVVFTIIEAFIIFGGELGFISILQLIADTLILKLLIDPISTSYAAIVARVLKRVEKIDVYDVGISYNPFSLS